MTKTQVILLSIAVFLIALGGCADRRNISPVPSITEEARQEIAAPVDCANARADIAVLEEEKASVGKRMLSGVRSLMPIAAVAGILMGDYRDRVEVTTGKYNDDLEAKIAEIKETCGIS